MQDWLEQRLAELEDTVQELESQCGALSVRLIQSEAKVAKLTEQLDELKQQNEAFAADIDDMAADMEELFARTDTIGQDAPAEEEAEEREETADAPPRRRWLPF